MGFNSVYQILLELFPQLDPRLLKAVAIEHAKDPDKAVESIVTEVLPFTNEKSNVANPTVRNSGKVAETPSPSSSILGSVAAVDPADSHLLDDSYNVDGDSLASSFYDAKDTDDLQNGNTQVEELILFTRCEETVGDASQAENLGIPSGSLIDECINDDCSQAFGDHEGESFVLSRDDQDKRTMNAEYCEADVSLSNHCNKNQDCIEDAPNVDYEGEQQSLDCNLFEYRNSANHASVSATEPEAGRGMFFSDADKEISNNVDADKEISNHVDADFREHIFVTDASRAEGETALSTVITHSGQICRISLVEDIIEEAKNYKDALFSATESVVKLIEDVELNEKEAEQAKAAAARGGLDILEKVEEMKKMLNHAKEANEMHAGEVYGEKSILATEVRELQTRLLGVADEKDKSLAMLDEMRRTLEARLAASEEERIAAEKHMLGKREIARDALVEQELIMEKVVQESKLLQQEAEENAKLRDFLMEKGHVVDELQGEISVICQDVKSLKEKFDNRVSLSRSLSIEQTSFRQASSTSSVKSHSSVMSVASDGHLEIQETPKIQSRAPSSIDSRTPRSNSGEETVGSGTTPRKELLDDDWELFDF